MGKGRKLIPNGAGSLETDAKLSRCSTLRLTKQKCKNVEIAFRKYTGNSPSHALTSLLSDKHTEETLDGT